MLTDVILLSKRVKTIPTEYPLYDSLEGRNPQNALVLTDETALLEECRKKGYAVLYVGEEETDLEYVLLDFEGVSDRFLRLAYARSKKLPMEIARTTHLLIREMTIEDLPELYEIYDDDQIRRYVEDLYEYEEEKKYTLESVFPMYHFYGYGPWLAIDLESGKLAGRVALGHREIQGRTQVELGYLLGKNYRHRGLAHEMTQAAITYFFTEHPDRDLYLLADPENIQSIRLAQKLGFVSQGPFEDQKLILFRKENPGTF